jgi:hypothetical protein
MALTGTLATITAREAGHVVEKANFPKGILFREAKLARLRRKRGPF